MVMVWCRADGRILADGFYSGSHMEDMGTKTPGCVWLRKMSDVDRKRGSLTISPILTFVKEVHLFCTLCHLLFSFNLTQPFILF